MSKMEEPIGPLTLLSETGGPVHPHGVFYGMVLLDYFAGQALQALLGDPNIDDAADVAARLAYEYAKAMIAERNKLFGIEQEKDETEAGDE